MTVTKKKGYHKAYRRKQKEKRETAVFVSYMVGEATRRGMPMHVRESEYHALLQGGADMSLFIERVGPGAMPTYHDLPINYTTSNSYTRRKVRLQYIALQRNKCCYCGHPFSNEQPTDMVDRIRPYYKALLAVAFQPLDSPIERLFTHPIHLHHSHSNGETIGAVHAVCNYILLAEHNQ